MGGSSILSARKDIDRGTIAPVYYLTGAEEILKDEFIDAVVERAVDPANRDFNVDFRSAGDLNAEGICALVETPPMLAERRVAVIRSLESWRRNSKPWQAIYQYVQSPSPTSVVILTHGAGQDADAKLVEHARHIAADTPDAEAQLEWVLEHGHSAGIDLTVDAAKHLITAVGGSLSQIAVEIDKLAAASTSESVDVDQVELLVGIRHGETLTDWVAAVLNRDFGRAIELLDVVLFQSGMSAVRMLAALGTSLVGVRLAQAQIDKGASQQRVRSVLFEELRRAPRTSNLGRWGDEVARWIRAAKAWTNLDEAIRRAYAADSQIKSTTINDPRDILHTMLLHFAAKETP